MSSNKWVNVFFLLATTIYNSPIQASESDTCDPSSFTQEYDEKVVSLIQNKLEGLIANDVISLGKQDRRSFSALLCYFFDKMSLEDFQKKLNLKKLARAEQSSKLGFLSKSGTSAEDKKYYFDTINLCNLSVSQLEEKYESEKANRIAAKKDKPSAQEDQLRGEISRRKNLRQKIDFKCKDYQFIEEKYNQLKGDEIERKDVEGIIRTQAGNSDKSFNRLMNIFIKRMSFDSKKFAGENTDDNKVKEVKYGKAPVDIMEAQKGLHLELAKKLDFRNQQKNDADKVKEGLQTYTFMVDVSPAPNENFDAEDMINDPNFENTLRQANEIINSEYKSMNIKKDKYVTVLKNLKSIAFAYKYAPLLAKLLSKSSMLHSKIEEVKEGGDWSDVYAFFVNGIINKQLTRTKSYNLGDGRDFNEIHMEFLNNLMVYEDEDYAKLQEALKNTTSAQKHFLYKAYFKNLANNPSALETLFKRRWTMLAQALPFAQKSKSVAREFVKAIEPTGCLIGVENKLQILLAGLEGHKDFTSDDMYKSWSTLDIQSNSAFLIWLLSRFSEENKDKGIQVTTQEFLDNQGVVPSNEDDDMLGNLLEKGKFDELKVFYEKTLERTFPQEDQQLTLKKNVENIMQGIKGIYSHVFS